MKKRADGRYLRTKDYNDGKGRQYFYGFSVDEVIASQKAYESQLKQSELNKNKFNYWADSWWENHQKEIRYNTTECYKKPLEDVKERFGNDTLTEIKASEIKNFYCDLRDLSLAKQTIKLRKIVLTQIYDFAIENDIVVNNIARAVKLPKNLPVTKRHGVPDDNLPIIKKSGDLYCNFLLYTGTRRNEALAIKWENIDFKNKTITITNALVWVHNKPVLESTKSAAGERVIPLLAPLERLLKPLKNKKGYLFSVNGNPLERKQFNTMWYNFRKKYDLDITAHQLRHSYVTILFYSGVDLKTAQGIVGHSNVETLLNIYTDLSKKNQSESREKLNLFMAS